ncbi:hypothetical protein NDN08_001798 [Rhodosorus marinus]|uniref:WLM domain-containing protein n=1 Tax=Rhodosorus marinus TaxID=101924 RepID=A0AAV8UXN1_9RHOD|nr:hypothetical protein NDN08_001798 [Rhodosorus marinus]
MVINTLDSEIFCVCDEVVTLGLPGDKYAKEILNQAAEVVKPIMAEKKWRVRVLAEFYPPQANLLGLNHDHGKKIQIRLRNPRDESQFLSEESVLQTLLHELCHNEVGPHNSQFYKLLDEITAKAENLIISKGFSTTSGGKKLSNERRNPDIIDKRRLSAVAAEKRVQRQQLFTKPVRLGGGQDQLHRVVDPHEMAYNAAMRRRKDYVCCATQVDSSRNTGQELEPDFGASTAGLAAGSKATTEVIMIDSDSEPEVILDSKDHEEETPMAKREPVNVKTRSNPVALAALRRMGQT